MPFFVKTIPIMLHATFIEENWILIVYKGRFLMNSRGWSVHRKPILKYMLLLVPYHTWSWSFNVNDTGHLQTNTVTGILFFWILYISIFQFVVFCLYINSVLLWHTDVQSSISLYQFKLVFLNKYFIMVLFISVFTINISFNDILFCLFKISFVC